MRISVFFVGFALVGAFSGSLQADQRVIGQLVSKNAEVAGATDAGHVISGSSTAYLSGEFIDTRGRASADLILSSGAATFKVTPDSLVSVFESSGEIEVVVREGALVMDVDEGVSLDLTHGEQTVVAHADQAVSAVVAAVDGEFFVIAKTEGLSVAANDGGTVSTLNKSEALVLAGDGRAELVATQGQGSSSNQNQDDDDRKKLIAILLFLGGSYILLEDDDGSPSS